jgi:hypothetical protein
MTGDGTAQRQLLAVARSFIVADVVRAAHFRAARPGAG